MNLLPITILAIAISTNAFAIRLKDLASLRGARDNQLVGYGLVVGLPGTGDRAGELTEGSLNLALKGLGIDPKNQKLGTKNAAAVLVSATLPAFARVGTKVDVLVSSIGSATSLDGGTLVMTPLKGADNKVYAMAQGRVEVSHKGERGSSRSPLLAATIPVAATLERDVAFDFSTTKELRYQLHQADFTTAARVAHKINEELAGKYATATDAGTIDVILPYALEENPVDWVARLESVDVEPDHKAKVVVNRKTGTIILGEEIRIFPVSMAHNNLRVIIKDDTRGPSEETSAAPAASAGPAKPAEAVAALPPTPPPVEVPNPVAQAKKPRRESFGNRGASIADMVLSLNEIGATPDDLIFMLQGMRSAGALVAELEIH